ncbi:hypothetical protein AU476_03990 [Cupriavidus sp. UYMSc13B]|nr:hypothetical protein AU476_03990 [Cupriavidus sp. UYMSc13B]
MTVPAGTVLTRTQSDMAPGYVVPAAVFPGGMPVAEFSTTIKAGTPFGKDRELAAGDRLPPAWCCPPMSRSSRCWCWTAACSRPASAATR